MMLCPNGWSEGMNTCNHQIFSPLSSHYVNGLVSSSDMQPHVVLWEIWMVYGQLSCSHTVRFGPSCCKLQFLGTNIRSGLYNLTILFHFLALLEWHNSVSSSNAYWDMAGGRNEKKWLESWHEIFLKVFIPLQQFLCCIWSWARLVWIAGRI